MEKKEILSFVKKLAVGMLAVGIIMTGIVATSKQAEAAVAEDTVIYDEEYKIADYWNNNKTAPVKSGYVFGGWFQESTEETVGAEKLTSADGTKTGFFKPLTEAELDTNSDGSVDFAGTAYAKFVPAQVLSVKAQNMAGTEERTETTYVRVISSLDSANYAKVGFDIWLANVKQLLKDDGEPLETTRIYDGLLVGTEQKVVTANEIFGGVSKYVSVWQLANIAKTNFNKIIYVRPYWVTMDGTKVEGLAKYVHIEDEYMGYISVPVNLLNKEDVAKVAAGAVNMSYTNAKAENASLTFKEVEAGRILPEMNYSHNDNVVKMVGNAKTVNSYNGEESIYANIRFIKPTDTTKDVDVTFNMTMVQFCDWDENPVDIDEIWDVEYVKEAVSE